MVYGSYLSMLHDFLRILFLYATSECVSFVVSISLGAYLISSYVSYLAALSSGVASLL